MRPSYSGSGKYLCLQMKNKKYRVDNGLNQNFALFVNFRVFTFYKHLLVPSGDNMDKKKQCDTALSDNDAFLLKMEIKTVQINMDQPSLFLLWSH